MSDRSVKLELKLNFPLFVGLSLLFHFLVILFFSYSAQTQDARQAFKPSRKPIIVTVGKENAKSNNSVFLKPEKPSFPQVPRKAGKKDLNLSDLMAPQGMGKTAPKMARPGKLPTAAPSALSAIKYGADDFKKLAQEPMLRGGADIITSDRVALNFEVPQGKNEDELNESQLRLYGFLRRGAMKYVASLSSEIKDFELQNPHLQFPMVENKQTLTGRLVYDKEGNLKQIKMVRWSNNDKLQGFFENVLKRLENLQNPPKELWADSGEFTIFVTLQING